MAARKSLNLAMIGSGFIAKAHSNAFRQVNHFFQTPYELKLKVVCGRNSTTVHAVAAQWGWQETGDDWRKIVERPDVDVVDIATPNVVHAPIAIAAAKAGKIILCEKPLAANLAEAERMTAAAANLPTLVWFNYRRVPAVVLAKQMIDADRLGDIYHYRALYLNESGNDPSKTSGWRYRKSDAGSGAIGDLLSHSLDTALCLNGPIADLVAVAHTFATGRDVDDAALVLAQFANGSIGSFEATRFGVGHRNRTCFEIHGSRGKLSFDLEDMNRLVFYDATEAAALRAPRSLMVPGQDHPYSQNFWKPGHAIGYEHTFIATLGDFLEALSRGEEFHPNFSDALTVQKLMHAIASSAKDKAWVKATA